MPTKYSLKISLKKAAIAVAVAGASGFCAALASPEVWQGFADAPIVGAAIPLIGVALATAGLNWLKNR